MSRDVYPTSPGGHYGWRADSSRPQYFGYAYYIPDYSYRYNYSVPFSTYLPYASYFNNGIAFHEYPDVPPYPASHGCVRVPTPEARRVYNFARMNTVVVVRS